MPAAAPPAADFKKPATPSAAAGQAEHGKNPAAAASKPGERQADAGKPAHQGPAGAPPATAKAGAAAPASGAQQRFDRMAVRAKLAVSEPGDAVERCHYEDKTPLTVRRGALRRDLVLLLRL